MQLRRNFPTRRYYEPMSTSIPLSQPWLTDAERIRVDSALRSGWLTQNGPDVKQMETDLQNLLNGNSDLLAFEKNYELTTTSNGTTALHLALLALGVGTGDEVIIPNYSYIAVVNAVIYCGATPIIADVSRLDWNIDPEDVANCISNRTKALIAVDNYGRLNDFRKLRSVVAGKFAIIQDAAESFPESFTVGKGYGDLITVSFYGNKVFTSAEGGAVAGPPEMIQKIRSLKNQSLGVKGTFSHVDIGYNYRITNIHAAIFNAQWNRRDEIMRERRRVFSIYSEILGNEWGNLESNLLGNPWLATLLVPENNKSIEQIREFLDDRGIETRPGFTLFTEQPFLQSYISLRPTPTSAKLSNRTLSLPTFPQLSDKEIARICRTLVAALE